MLLPDTSRLDEHLILLLASRSAATSQALKDELARRGLTYSVQGIYKELRKLRAQGVVLKHQQRYSLSLPWILNLMALADNMFEAHLREASLHTLLPDSGGKYVWTFSNLLKLDDFWMHIILLLFSQSNARVMYQWLPHPWFHLAQKEKSPSFQKAIELGGFRVFSIIGGDTYLDLWSKQITTPGAYEFSYARGPFHEQRTHAYSLIDPYLLTVTLDQGTTRKIDELYQKVTSIESLPVGEVVRLMQSTVHASMRIENSPAKARRMLRKMQDYFGHD
jgi:hypothetical protein